MDDLLIRNGKGARISMYDAAKEIDQMESPCVATVEFAGRMDWTLDLLRDILKEQGTINYSKLEKKLADKRFPVKNVVRNWVQNRVLIAIDDLEICGDFSGISDPDYFVRSYKKSLAADITDDIIDTMMVAQRKGY